MGRLTEYEYIRAARRFKRASSGQLTVTEQLGRLRISSCSGEVGLHVDIFVRCSRRLLAKD